MSIKTALFHDGIISGLPVFSPAHIRICINCRTCASLVRDANELSESLTTYDDRAVKVCCCNRLTFDNWCHGVQHRWLTTPGRRRYMSTTGRQRLIDEVTLRWPRRQVAVRTVRWAFDWQSSILGGLASTWEAVEVSPFSRTLVLFNCACCLTDMIKLIIIKAYKQLRYPAIANTSTPHNSS